MGLIFRFLYEILSFLGLKVLAIMQTFTALAGQSHIVSHFDLSISQRDSGHFSKILESEQKNSLTRFTFPPKVELIRLK